MAGVKKPGLGAGVFVVIVLLVVVVIFQVVSAARSDEWQSGYEAGYQEGWRGAYVNVAEGG